MLADNCDTGKQYEDRSVYENLARISSGKLYRLQNIDSILSDLNKKNAKHIKKRDATKSGLAPKILATPSKTIDEGQSFHIGCIFKTNSKATMEFKHNGRLIGKKESLYVIFFS